MEVELNVSQDTRSEPDWRQVKLLFVRGVKGPGEGDVGKKDWALFVTTDVGLSVSKMLEIYALRWGIEVYFKEAKQHLGFVTEQTRTFVSHVASIHLCAIRYLMLVHAKLTTQELRISDARVTIRDQLNRVSFFEQLWALFRMLIGETLHDIEKDLGCSVATVMQSIEDRVNEFLVQSLQLDSFTLRMEDG